MSIRGIDVSTYDGNINWEKVKGDKHGGFAIIKATQGKSIYSLIKRKHFTDGKFTRNMTNAIKNNIPIGVYHYLTASTEAEAVAEANYFISVIEKYRPYITLYAAVDVEEDSIYKNLTKAKVTAIVDTFCEKVKAAGYKPIVYLNRNYLNYRLNKADLIAKWDIWQAHWSDSKPNDCGDRLKIWQFGAVTVDGIVPPADGNFGYFEVEQEVPFKEGNKVIIKKGAKYGGSSSGTGKKVPTSILNRIHTISKIKTFNGKEEALLKEIVSWVALESLEKV